MSEIVAFFVGLGFWPIVILVFFTVLDIICLSTEKEGWGTLGSLLGIAAFCWAAQIDVWPIYWVGFLKYVGVYIAIGMLWSVAKWYFFLVKKRDELRAQVKRGYKDIGEHHIPTASDNKARIMSWIGHWPFSLLATLLGDWMASLWRAVYETLSGLYEKMALNVFKEFRNQPKAVLVEPEGERRGGRER